MGSIEKHFTDPCARDCDMARFIWVAGYFCVPFLSVPPWRKYNGVFSKAKTKASVQSFWFILKLSASAPAQSAAGPQGYWTHMVVCVPR